MEVISHSGWSSEEKSLRATTRGLEELNLSVSCLHSGIWRLTLTPIGEDPCEHASRIEVEPLDEIKLDFETFQADGVRVSTSQDGSKTETPCVQLSTRDLKLSWSSTDIFVSRISSVNRFPVHPRRGANEQRRLPEEGLALGLLTRNKSCTYYGLGERVGGLDKRGGFWENWNTDVHHIRSNTDPLYQSHPVLIQKDQSGNFSALFLNEVRRCFFELEKTAKGEGWIITEATKRLELYLIPGPSIVSLLQNLCRLLGRSPLPPLWAFGYHHCRWSFEDDEEVRSLAEGFRKRGLPLEALWLDIGHLDRFSVFSFAKEKFPSPQETFNFLKERNIRSVVIVNPCVTTCSDLYPEGKKRDLFITDASGEPLEGAVWTGPVVWPDFTNPAARSWWGEQYRFYLNLGVDGFWNDMNEPSASNWSGRTLPDDARMQAGTHGELHNLYGSLMAQATYEGLRQLRSERRPFVLTRSGHSGIHRYAWSWTGDCDSSWEHLALSVPMILNMGLSGAAFVGADIGGFYGDADGELLARWMWLGAFYPFMRNHAAIGTGRQEPWIFDSEHSNAVSGALKFRYRLLPYLYTLAKEAAEQGVPLLRPMFFADPNDPELNELSDQFLCGDALLVAPILSPGQEKRAAYFPRGTWFDFWSGEKIVGPGWKLIEVPLDRIGLYQREGTAVPLTDGSIVYTTTAYWSALSWRIAPGKFLSGLLFEDEGDGFVDHGRFTRLSGSLKGSTLRVTLNPAPATAQSLELLTPERNDSVVFSGGSAELFCRA